MRLKKNTRHNLIISGEVESFTIRMPAYMFDTIKKRSEETNRSINFEIIDLLSRAISSLEDKSKYQIQPDDLKTMGMGAHHD